MRIGKTVIGSIGFGICAALSVLFPPAAAICLPLQKTVFLPLMVVGIGHKLDRIN